MMNRRNLRLIDRRGLSPIFATVILVAIVVVFGSLAYYFSSNLTNNATNNYVGSVATSQQSDGERLAFENVIYTPSSLSSPATLKVYVLNSGISNNLQIDTIFIYNSNSSSHTLLAYYSHTKFNSPGVVDLNTLTPRSGLNIGEEGNFTVTLNPTSLGPVPSLKGTVCDLRITTESGSAFDYEFAP
jgi:flagellin-like protein